MFENETKQQAVKTILESVKEYYKKFMIKTEYKEGESFDKTGMVVKVNLNNNKQILELKEKGEKYIDGYIFRMEEYLPYITEYLSSFIRGGVMPS